jgi:hypothetical protein
MQLFGFKEVWTNHFSDAMLFLVGFGIIGFSQILDVNWTPVRVLTFMAVSLLCGWPPHFTA